MMTRFENFFVWLHVQAGRTYVNDKGAVLVEFAIIANILIVMNILTYDFAAYYRLSQQIKHGAQFIHTILTNDADHTLMTADLEKQIDYLKAVTGLPDMIEKGALIVIDVMPYRETASAKWSLLVCWSWSSNPAKQMPPAQGTILSSRDYDADPWAPESGVSAGAALVIVEVLSSNSRLLDISLVPATTTQHYIGPVRYQLNGTHNLHLYAVLGGPSLNDSTKMEPAPSNAIACQR